MQAIDTDSALYKKLMLPVIDRLLIWRDSALTPSERALLEGQISQEERQANGIAKAPYVAQFVRALVESGERVLLFAHHHAVMDTYKRELKSLSPVFITGRETAAQKEASVERFMAGRTSLCCVSLRAASGLNLQQATCGIRRAGLVTRCPQPGRGPCAPHRPEGFAAVLLFGQPAGQRRRHPGRAGAEGQPVLRLMGESAPQQKKKRSPPASPGGMWND